MLTFLLLILFFSGISFMLGYLIGERKGAKDGIDYCFNRMEKDLKGENTNDT